MGNLVKQVCFLLISSSICHSSEQGQGLDPSPEVSANCVLQQPVSLFPVSVEEEVNSEIEKVNHIPSLSAQEEVDLEREKINDKISELSIYIDDFKLKTYNFKGDKKQQAYVVLNFLEDKRNKCSTRLEKLRSPEVGVSSAVKTQQNSAKEAYLKYTTYYYIGKFWKDIDFPGGILTNPLILKIQEKVISNLLQAFTAWSSSNDEMKLKFADAVPDILKDCQVKEAYHLTTTPAASIDDFVANGQALKTHYIKEFQAKIREVGMPISIYGEPKDFLTNNPIAFIDSQLASGKISLSQWLEGKRNKWWERYQGHQNADSSMKVIRLLGK